MSGNLTDEERDILESFERGEWKSVDNVKDEIKRITNIAIENQKRYRKMVSFSVDIDLVEWLNSKAPEDKRHNFINKALRAYIARLEEGSVRES